MYLLILSRNAEEVSLFTKPDSFVNEKAWCFDSGCTSYMCNDANSFIQVSENEEVRKLNLASNASTDILGCGVVSTETTENGNRKVLKLGDTLFVPDLRKI